MCDSHRTVTFTAPGTAHLAWPLIAPNGPMVTAEAQHQLRKGSRGRDSSPVTLSSQLRSDVPHAPQRDAQSVRGAVGLE